MNHIYLDANSTTRLDQRVRKVMSECFDANYVNPSSQHRPGQLARRQIEIARDGIVRSLGGSPKDRLIFTSGGTESNNLAVIGLASGMAPRAENEQSPEVIVSSVEHPSVLGASEFLRSQGFVVHQLPVDQSGRALTESLEKLITSETRLVSLMLANNETGAIQDIASAAKICNQRDVLLHCDAVQAIGKVPVCFREMGVSALTMTAHKLHGPRGIGGLLLAEDLDLQPMMFGGFQQLGQRPGTEDVALASGFAKAIELAVDGMVEHSDQLRELRDLFEATILAELPDTVINGVDGQRAPHTSNLSFPGSMGSTASTSTSESTQDSYATVNRQALLMAVDAAGVAISTGSACASGSSEPSHVLTSMGLAEDIVESSIRVSLSILTTRSEVVEGANRIINAVKHLRRN